MPCRTPHRLPGRAGAARLCGRRATCRPADQVVKALGAWLARLDPHDDRYDHHRLEALWVYRSIGQPRPELLRSLLASPRDDARAAAVKQLPFWYSAMKDGAGLLLQAADDPSPHVRMEAVMAASWIGSREAYDAVLHALRHPYDGHLEYALACALESEPLRGYWESQRPQAIAALYERQRRRARIRRPKRSAADRRFDRQADLKQVDIGCVPERMQYTVRQFTVRPGQPVKIVFSNPDATDHNLVITRPGALAEVGMAANEMARDPRNATSDFIPRSKRPLILHYAPMIGPNRSSRLFELRFHAPRESGVYPYVCTFPGHWVVMNGVMVVAANDAEAERLLAAAAPQVIRRWKLADFPPVKVRTDEATATAGMLAFVKARCNQCHVLAGHGVNLGPDLKTVAQRFRGKKLLQHILQPSAEIHKDFQTYQFLLADGRVVSGVVKRETADAYDVITNLLLPETLVTIRKQDVEERLPSAVSAMPEGLLDVLTRDEIMALLGLLERGGAPMPGH